MKYRIQATEPKGIPIDKVKDGKHFVIDTYEDDIFFKLDNQGHCDLFGGAYQDEEESNQCHLVHPVSVDKDGTVVFERSE